VDDENLMNAKDARPLIEKLQSLPLQRQAEVEDLVDSLHSREDGPYRVSATRTGIKQHYERLKQSPKTASLVAVIRRFVEIDGFTLSGLVSIQLFTTVIPLIIIGFAYFSGFASNASVGDLFIRDLGLHHPFDDRVREAFGTPSGVQYVWTFLGLSTFLFWGIPMSIKVATIFGQAWRRKQFGMAQKLGRGVAWFVLYLGIMAAHERIGFAGKHDAGVRASLLVLSLLPVWIFWSLTPMLLVRDGGRGWKYYLLAGFAGVVIDGIVITAVVRVGFPILLRGWTGFGPMGVAMTLMTWCGVIATGWVVIACTTAIIWERISVSE
jgi:hypothetical protein